ncbi:MAG: putative glycoside hydrolase [Oscillospiraceae bacterium]|nr:putative glycoside hydrolase [Oscillospiraceae bacterium]
MAKQYKIKRYRRIYQSNRNSRVTAGGVIVTALVLLAAAFVGWSLYGPVSDFISGRLTVERPSSSSSQAEESQESSQAPLDQEKEPEQSASEAFSGLHAAYLPTGTLRDEAALQAALTSLQAKGVNAVVYDAKDPIGQVFYNSTNERVLQCEAVTAAPYDISRVNELLHQNGFKAIARVYAFKDHIASRVLLEGAVKYLDTDWLWLDNSRDAGGRSWLNPYSEVARMYVADIALECVEKGADAVMLDGLHFPVGVGLELASYGTGSSAKTRQEALSEFVQATRDLVEKKGGALMASASGSAMLLANSVQYPDSPLKLPLELFAPDVMPASFGSGVASETLTLTDPVLSPYDTVYSVMKRIAAGKTEQNVFLPFVQAYSTPDYGREYTSADVSEQLRALSELGITGYILYDPSGSYTLLP